MREEDYNKIKAFLLSNNFEKAIKYLKDLKNDSVKKNKNSLDSLEARLNKYNENEAAGISQKTDLNQIRSDLTKLVTRIHGDKNNNKVKLVKINNANTSNQNSSKSSFWSKDLKNILLIIFSTLFLLILIFCQRNEQKKLEKRIQLLEEATKISLNLDENDILLYGSGTVRDFLFEHADTIFNNRKYNVIPFEGPSELGIAHLAHSYRLENDSLSKPVILGMSSNQQTDSIFKEKDVLINEDDRYFEIFLGYDELKITIGVPPNMSSFDTVFSGLSPFVKPNSDRKLTINQLASYVLSDKNISTKSLNYDIYITSKGSGTLNTYLEELKKVNKNNLYKDPSLLYKNQSEDRIIKNLEKERAFIVLGSTNYNIKASDIRKDQNGKYKNSILEFGLVSNENKILTKKMFIYGKLPSSTLKKNESIGEYYELNEITSLFFSDLLGQLHSNVKVPEHGEYLGDDLNSQKSVFLKLNLDNSSGKIILKKQSKKLKLIRDVSVDIKKY